MYIFHHWRSNLCGLWQMKGNIFYNLESHCSYRNVCGFHGKPTNKNPVLIHMFLNFLLTFHLMKQTINQKTNSLNIKQEGETNWILFLFFHTVIIWHKYLTFPDYFFCVWKLSLVIDSKDPIDCYSIIGNDMDQFLNKTIRIIRILN